jgi:sugar lactone lactonase YvrE
MIHKQRELKTLISGRRFLENPRWHDGRFWVSDLYSYEVLCVTPGGKTEVVAEVPGQPSGLGWLPDGRLIVVSMTDRKLLRLEPSGKLVVHADLSDLTPWWLSDIVVDSRTGNAYLGPVGFDVMVDHPVVESTNIFHIAPNGKVTAYGSDIVLPNGHAISPDGKTLVLSECFGRQMTAFDMHEDGSLTNQRVWASFGGHQKIHDLEEFAASGVTVPDGICFDAEGALWIADAYNGRAIRVREGGEIVDEIKHDKIVPAVALGGPDGKTLFLCAALSANDKVCKSTRSAEVVYTQVEVGHAGYP